MTNVKIIPAHEYLSTACWHEQHDGKPEMHASCRATCKWCSRSCGCPNHPQDTAETPPHWVDQARDIARKLLDAMAADAIPPGLAEQISNDPHLFWLRGEEQPPGLWRPEPEDATDTQEGLDAAEEADREA